MRCGVMTNQRPGFLFISLLLVVAMLFSAALMSELSYSRATVARYIQAPLTNEWVADAGSAEADWLLQCEHASKRLATPSISSLIIALTRLQEQCPKVVFFCLFLFFLLFVPRKILPRAAEDEPFLT